MANNFVSILKSAEIRKKIVYTLFIILITRIGAIIPIPGIIPSSLSAYFQSLRESASNNSLMELLDFFSGGAFSNFSIFMLGVMPYISAQIIVQLVMIIIPSLREMSKEPTGAMKIQRMTRYGTILVCLIQSFAVTVYARSIPNLLSISMTMFTVIALISCTAGSMLMIWLGERISDKGIGNGISLLIFAGIVARFPNAVITLVNGVVNSRINIVSLAVLLVIFVAVIVMIIYEEKGERKIYITYSKRIVGRKIYGAQSSHIPFKLNPSGVIPVIFASAILAFPLQLATALGPSVRWLARFANFLNPQGDAYIIIYTLLIIMFAFFYTQVTLNPIEISKQIRDNGGSINGVRSDKMEEYLTKVLNRIILPGSLFLAFIALLPTMVQVVFKFPSDVAMVFGGTSLLIMVGVELETMRSINAILKTQNKVMLSSRNRQKSL